MATPKEIVEHVVVAWFTIGDQSSCPIREPYFVRFSSISVSCVMKPISVRSIVDHFHKYNFLVHLHLQILHYGHVSFHKQEFFFSTFTMTFWSSLWKISFFIKALLYKCLTLKRIYRHQWVQQNRGIEKAFVTTSIRPWLVQNETTISEVLDLNFIPFLHCSFTVVLCSVLLHRSYTQLGSSIRSQRSNVYYKYHTSVSLVTQKPVFLFRQKYQQQLW